MTAYQVILEELTYEEANLAALILAASGISCQIEYTDEKWSVRVLSGDMERAIAEIAAYRLENEQPDSERDLEPEPGAFRPGISGGLFAAVILLASHIAVGIHKTIYVDTFGASAKRILDGDFYRCTTALFLHADYSHLVANMIGIMVFGTGACSVSGWGLGWLLILFSGIIGNFINAYIHAGHHVSIGASTSVFGAIGILSGFRLLEYSQRSGNGFKRFTPLFAGLALLGFLGSGENTDLGAHFFGFLTGLVLGVILSNKKETIRSDYFQAACLALTFLIVIFFWRQGF